jgi:hypothetical protein
MAIHRSDLKNGDLPISAEAEGFDALMITDQNLRYQQSLSGRRLGVVVLIAAFAAFYAELCRTPRYNMR